MAGNRHIVYREKRNGDLVKVGEVCAASSHGAIEKARADALADGFPLIEGNYAAFPHWSGSRCHVHAPGPDEPVPAHLS